MSQVAVCFCRRHAAARGAVKKSQLHQKRLVHFLYSLFFLGDGSGNFLSPTGPPANFKITVSKIFLSSAVRPISSISRRASASRTRSFVRSPFLHLREIAATLQKKVSNARREARAARNFCRRIRMKRDAQNAGRTAHNPRDLFVRVKLKAECPSGKAGAKRRGEERYARCCGNERKRREFNAG